jgi:hypothetical protein
VRVNLPSAERAAELVARRPAPALQRRDGVGPAPLLERRPLAPPRRRLSYTAIGAERDRLSVRMPDRTASTSGEGTGGLDREGAVARGIAVHGLLEWSANNGWQEPSLELARHFAEAAGLDLGPGGDAEAVLGPVRSWLDSGFFTERVRSAERSRAELPFLVRVAERELNGSIDLLVERDGGPPLIVDYKTDRLDGSSPTEHLDRYATQQALYPIAVAEALNAPEVEIAYFFLDRPGEPVARILGKEEIEAGRELIEAEIAEIEAAAQEPAEASSLSASSSRRSSFSPSPTASSSPAQ